MNAEEQFARIKYAGKIAAIPDFAAGALIEIMDWARVRDVIITSTTRTPKDQARIMFQNIEDHGVDMQLELYKEPGKRVVAVYQSLKGISGITDDQIKIGMENKIIEVGSQNVSRHCANPWERSVFDVAPSSVPDENKPAFEAMVSGHPRVIRFLKPPHDPAYHIEIIA
jgi:hypothetical protein